MKKSTVVKATVTRKATASAARKAEQDAVRRRQAALRAIDKLDAQRIAHPHVPALAAQIERNDAVNWQSPVIRAITAPPGPRTASHPMATRVEPAQAKPMATRFRPSHLMESGEMPDRRREIVNAALSGLVLCGLVMTGVWLGSK